MENKNQDNSNTKVEGEADSQTEPVRMSISDALNTVNLLKNEVAELKKINEKISRERDQANAVLHGQVRANLLQQARAKTTIPESKLQEMGNDALETVLQAVEVSKGNPKSVLFGADRDESNGTIDLYTERQNRLKQLGRI